MSPPSLCLYDDRQVSVGQTTSAGNRDLDTALAESVPVREAFKKKYIYADICKRYLNHYMRHHHDVTPITLIYMIHNNDCMMLTI